MRLSPITQRKIAIFKSKKISFISLILIIILYLISLCAEFWVNDKPLVVKYKGVYYFPIVQVVSDEELGGFLPTEADFSDQDLVAEIENHGFLIMPLIPYHYSKTAADLTSSAPTPPDSKHFLGTDAQGKDVIAQAVYGFRLFMNFSFLVVFFSTIIGVLVGSLQGYYGGRIDLFGQRFVEIWSAIPAIYILILLVSLSDRSFFLFVGFLVFFDWIIIVPYVRAEVLKVRNLAYVKAAKVMGLSDFKILKRHIIPNALVSTVTFVPFLFKSTIASLIVLQIIGLALNVKYPSLGNIVISAMNNLQAAWLTFVSVGVLTFILTLLVLIGYGLREANDPYVG